MRREWKVTAASTRSKWPRVAVAGAGVILSALALSALPRFAAEYSAWVASPPAGPRWAGHIGQALFGFAIVGTGVGGFAVTDWKSGRSRIAVAWSFVSLWLGLYLVAGILAFVFYAVGWGESVAAMISSTRQ